jgi:hypothetical protein
MQTLQYSMMNIFELSSELTVLATGFIVVPVFFWPDCGM